MINTYTYFGTDGTLSVSDPDGLEADVFGEYFGESGAVARVTGVALAVSTDVRAFHELGSRLPSELRAGNISIQGSVDRAYVNGALLQLMLGPYAVGEESPGMKVPTFNLKLILDNLRPAGDEGNSVLTVYGVVFDNWRWSLPEEDFALEKLTFRGRRVAVNDAPVGT